VRGWNGSTHGKRKRSRRGGQQSRLRLLARRPAALLPSMNHAPPISAEPARKGDRPRVAPAAIQRRRIVSSASRSGPPTRGSGLPRLLQRGPSELQEAGSCRRVVRDASLPAASLVSLVCGQATKFGQAATSLRSRTAAAGPRPRGLEGVAPGVSKGSFFWHVVRAEGRAGSLTFRCGHSERERWLPCAARTSGGAAHSFPPGVTGTVRDLRAEAPGGVVVLNARGNKRREPPSPGAARCQLHQVRDCRPSRVVREGRGAPGSRGCCPPCVTHQKPDRVDTERRTGEGRVSRPPHLRSRQLRGRRVRNGEHNRSASRVRQLTALRMTFSLPRSHPCRATPYHFTFSL